MGDVMRKSVLLHYYHTCERTYLSIHPQPFPSHCRRNEPKLLFIVRLVARAPALRPAPARSLRPLARRFRKLRVRPRLRRFLLQA